MNAAETSNPGGAGPFVPGKIILAGTVGSTAYGLATETSDVDTLGVYTAPTVNILGIHGGTLTEHTVTSTKPDSTFHEVGKYVRLALKANPTILELLYLPTHHHTTVAEEGQLLLTERVCFLGRETVRSSYGGYAMNQAKKLMERQETSRAGFGSVPVNRTEKHARHCVRLLAQGIQLLTEQTITVDVGGQRDSIFAAGRLAVENPAQFETLVRRKMNAFDLAVDMSALPEHPDMEKANMLLTRIRLGNLAVSGFPHPGTF